MSILEDMCLAIEEARQKLLAIPLPPKEMKLHPADIAELRRKCETARDTGPAGSWCGVMIIPDESAERLPRKAT